MTITKSPAAQFPVAPPAFCGSGSRQVGVGLAVRIAAAMMEISQYSWRNALVAEVDGALAGAVIGYDGARLLAAMRDRALAEGHERVGLLVDFGNPDAERLYLSLGFTRMEERKFLGHDMWHLQYYRK